MNLISNKNKTEEILKWRHNNNNNGENSPSILSCHYQQQQQQEGTAAGQEIIYSIAATNSLLKNSPLKSYKNDGSTNNNNKFYITLAKESPKHYDSDTTATYDSYHARTTDVCNDSCDTESNSSDYSIEGIATVEVVEYEVASASASEYLYSNDSSSGTDEDLIAMAKELLESEFVSVNNKQQSGCGFWSSDFADTEESDNSDNCIDSELSPADYWLCVKCKNRQNNPMFRYCEKCYQIRKTHFPPRPKLRKTRKNRKRKSPIFSYNNSIDHKKRKPNTPSNCHQDELIKSTDTILNQQIPTIYLSPTASTSSTTNEIGKNQLNLTNSNIIKFNKINEDEENSRLNDNKKTNNSKHNNIPYKKRKLNYRNNSNISSQLNSTSETSDSDNHDSYSNNSYLSFDEHLSNLGKKFFSPCKNENNNITYKSANIKFNNNSRCNNNRKRKATSSIVIDGDDIGSEICSSQANFEKFVNNNSTNLLKRKRDINLNSDNDDSETDLINNNHIINSKSLFDKDSGISSAPSTQDYGELTDILQPHCSTTSVNEHFNNESDKKIKNNIINIKDDGNESSDTICEELNEKDIVELEKHVILSPVHTNNNLRTIESPQSPSANVTSTIALDNSTNNNCTNKIFDDKLSSLLLNQSDSQIDSSYGLCIICVTEPKNGAFVHSRFVHLSCCYKCAVKIWNKNKKCPICNCAVKNVMKLVVY